MSRIVKCGLIQTSLAADTSEPIEKIRDAQIERTLGYIDQAGQQGVQMICMQEIFTGPYFCAEQSTRWYDSVEKIPDGHTTKGLDKHIDDLKWMFTFAPDARVTEHPVRFGTQDAEWTAVTGWIEGTFSKPMTLPDGSTVQPTGKTFRIPMATIGHWNKAGSMSEEYLVLDNSALMQQIGAGK